MTIVRKTVKYSLIASASFLSVCFLSNPVFAQDVKIMVPADDDSGVSVPMNGGPVSVPMKGPVSVPMTGPAASKIDTTYMPASSTDALKYGLKAANSQNWSEVIRMKGLASDDAVKKALDWRMSIDSSSGLGFNELKKNLEEMKNYPNTSDIRTNIEKNIERYGLSTEQRIEFLTSKAGGLKNDGPISGEGKMYLGAALIEKGRESEGVKLIQDAWRNSVFDANTQSNFLSRFSKYLTQKDYDQRADLLLWESRGSQTRELIPYLSQSGLANVQSRTGSAVTAAAPADSKYAIYKNVYSLRKQNRDTEALNLLLSIDSTGLPLPAAEDIWTERRIMLVEALKNKRYKDAYKLVSQNGLTLASSSKYADANFLSGWIALRYLNDSQSAIKYFENFDAAVESGMSKSRGYYWLGRAYEERKDNKRAEEFYNKAASYPTFYYGQLAAARLAQKRGKTATLNLPKAQSASYLDRSRIDSNMMVRIAKNFEYAGEKGYFAKFIYAVDDTIKSNGELEALSEYANSVGENIVGIRAAKAGLTHGVVATKAAFPVIPVPHISTYNQAEDAFTLAITRQETEFNTAARSPVGALGLMQFMPATAQKQAKKMGVSYQTSWLISDPEYSLKLGSSHLADMTNNFYGSYVLAIISYNAGPGRSAQWTQTYGDIRGADTDTAIDWVEQIPFSETRNYVQRVLENIQVYRARLNGDSAPLQIFSDLTRGTKPPQVMVVPMGDDKPVSVDTDGPVTMNLSN